MKEPRHDDERLSALLAGRLEGPERDELLAYLSTADEDLEVFAHTAAILREMDEEDVQEDAQDEEPALPKVPGPGREVPVPSMTRSARGWPRKTPRWAIVAAIVGLVVLGPLTLRRGGTPGVSPLQLAANIDVTGPGLPLDASRPAGGIPGGNVTRGDGDADQRPESAAQAGAFLVRLALAIRARDSAATATLAQQTRDRFDPQGGGALQNIAARAGAPTAELHPLLTQATERLEDYLEHPAYLRLGAWTEAARFAARQRDAAFFESGDSRDMMRLAERLTKGDAQGQPAAVAIRDGVDAEGEPDWTALGNHLTALLEAIAT